VLNSLRLGFRLMNVFRFSLVTKKACFRSRGVSKTRIFFCPAARITVHFVGTRKHLRSSARYASLSRERLQILITYSMRSFPQRTTGRSKYNGVHVTLTCWQLPFSTELSASTLSSPLTMLLKAKLASRHLSRTVLTFSTTPVSHGLTRSHSR